MLSTAPAAAATALPAEVAAALDRARVPREALAAVVQEVGAEAQPARLEWQAAQPLNPASLTKLVTTAAALELLGPGWSWQTPVWLDGRVVKGGVLEGDLVIRGSGDPKLVVERVWLLLRRVQQAGVTDIRGDIVLDRSAFRADDTGPAEFDGEPTRPYNVRADALLLNYKSVQLAFTPDPARGVATIAVDPPLDGVRVDASVPLGVGRAAACDDWRGALQADFSDPQALRFGGVFPSACGDKAWPQAYADPASYNARLLRALWRDMGGRLEGGVRDGTAPARPPTFEFASPPLAEVIRDINKFSNNAMAQQLFLTLGLVRRGSGTPEAAREVLRGWLDARAAGAAAGSVIDNGSGLSRTTRLSAAALARLLQAAWAAPTMPELMSSLPVSGVDGTLRRSAAMGVPAVLGRAHLKTGSLRDVVGVAGYVLAASGRRYVLVAIVNHPNAAAARPALDALLQWTLTLRPRAAAND